MKSSNFIKLLAALLCVAVMFVSCSGETANGTTDVDTLSELGNLLLDEAGPEDTETKPTSVDDFFTVKPADKKLFIEAEKIEGELIAESEYNIVVRNVEVNPDNTVNEVFTVYNMISGKSVLTLENTYDYTLNPDVLQESEIEFDFEYGHDEYGYDNPTYGMYLIKVSKITRGKLTEEEKANNYRLPEGAVYTQDTVIEYYDVNGVLVDTSNTDEFVETVELESDMGGMFGTVKTAAYEVIIGNKIHVFGVLYNHMYSVDVANQTTMRYFDAENSDYGYYFNADVNGYTAMQVFDKLTGALVFQHYYENQSEELMRMAHVLNDGNVLVQTVAPIYDDGADYDITIEGQKVSLDSCVVDITTGEVKSADLNYIVLSVMTRSVVENEMALTTAMGANYEFSDAFENMAFAYKAAEKAPMVEIGKAMPDIVFLTNDGEVQFADDFMAMMMMESGFVIPEGVNVEIVASQYSEPYYRLTLVDGTVVELPMSVEIYDNCIVTDVAIYDLSLEKLYELGENESFVDVFAGSMIIEREIKVGIDYDDDGDYDDYNYTYEYYEVKKFTDCIVNGDEEEYVERWGTERILRDMTIDSISADYMIVYDNENGEYTLYNADFEHVITTDGDMYVISGAVDMLLAYSDGEYTLYTLKVEAPAADDGTGADE